MTADDSLPPEIEPVRQRALRALRDVRPAHDQTQTVPNFWLNAKRTQAGRCLPEYYLVYFLLVELLNFPHRGPEEKVAWTIPLDFRGNLFTIEHRKMGLGLFHPEPERVAAEATEIVNRILKATKEARRFFDWFADTRVAQSAINVANHSQPLYERYRYLRQAAQDHADKAKKREAERRAAAKGKTDLSSLTEMWLAEWHPEPQPQWMALSAVEAYFSWTEHALIHLAILQGRITTGDKVAVLASGDWTGKFKSAIDVTEEGANTLLDRVLAVRQDLRNHVAHGAFGKQGEAFFFHSPAGAVPVLLPHRKGPKHFRFGNGLAFDALKVFQVLDHFEAFMFAGIRAPAREFLLENTYPTVLTMARSAYVTAMRSPEAMTEFLHYWGHQVDRSADMDW
ncbi:hypothetical protein FHY13_003125 [Xanthomonas arboricola]|uniref:hypothetical protein n=1 Tax=Xanthomonas euroxanthea TaxID=2259622 RepID=UPI00160707B3|nr:hypothetical protein [Xanthomonas euroxanthea]MBB3814754.1 hypothetical protein [Xanthomonas euroxanthea]